MFEMKRSDVTEAKKPEIETFKEIKPESNITTDDARNYWDNEFAKLENSSLEQNKHYDDNGNLYRDGDNLLPNKEFSVNDYTYKTDDMGRIVSAEGTLQIKDHKGRNEMPDSREAVARGEMKSSDDRGHLIADRFNGSGELENLVPMEGNLNKGDYLKLEDTLAAAVNDGADVKLKVEPIYADNTYRPNEFRVSYSIDDDKEVVVFKNRSEE